jgi:hypothetical protein
MLRNQGDPYLLRGVAVTEANQVWCTDIYLPAHGSGAFLSGGADGLV